MIALVVTVLCVGAALGLDRLTREGAFPHVVFLSPDEQFARKVADLQEPRDERTPSAQTLDDSPVASIPGSWTGSVRLDPCTGATK